MQLEQQAVAPQPATNQMPGQRLTESNSGMSRQQTGGSNFGAVKKQSTSGRSNPASSGDITQKQQNTSHIHRESEHEASDSREGQKMFLNKESSGI